MYPRRVFTGARAPSISARQKRRWEAPWLDKLPAYVYSLLELPDLRAIPPDALRQADIVVVGGGITGLSGAHAAAASGARVLLLEAGLRLGLGASGRNAGIVSVGANLGLSDLPKGSPLAALWPATTAIANSLFHAAAQPASILEARQTGALSLASGKEKANWLLREAEARSARGLRAEVWTPEQVAGRTSGRLDIHNVQAALWLPDEGRIYPHTLLAHLAEQARREGATLVGGAEVVAFREEDSQQRAGQVSRWELHLHTGVTIATRGLIWATGPTIAASARLYALAFQADLPDDFPVFWDASPFTYYDYRPGNGWLVVSGGPYGAEGAADRDALYHRRMAATARRWLPELARQRPHYTWAVDLAVTAEMLPTTRNLGSKAPGYAIEGLGAQGVLPGILLGRQAGEMLARQLM